MNETDRPAHLPAPVKTTATNVLAFQKGFAAVIPGILRELWARWTKHVPDAKAIYIGFLFLPDDFQSHVVAEGGKCPPVSERDFIPLFRPVLDLWRPDAWGVDHPSLILMRYDGEKLDVDMVWNPWNVGIDVDYVETKFHMWSEALVTGKGEIAMRKLMFSTLEVRRASGDAVCKGLSLDSLSGLSFDWSHRFKVALGHALPAVPVLSAATVKRFEADFLAVLPGIVRDIWAIWSECVPEATQFYLYAGLFPFGKLVCITTAGRGGSLTPAAEQEEAHVLYPLVQLSVGVRGVDFPGRIVIRCIRGGRVDIDMSWDLTRTPTTQEETFDEHLDLEKALRAGSQNAAKRLLHSKPGAPEMRGDVIVTNAEVDGLTVDSFEWSESFRKTLGVWVPPQPDQVKVKAFEAEFAKLIPDIVRKIWKGWTFYVPDATAINILLAIIPHFAVPVGVSPSNGDRSAPPDAAQAAFGQLVAPLYRLGVPGVRGLDFPAFVIVRYVPDTVDIDMRWDLAGTAHDMAGFWNKMLDFNDAYRNGSEDAAKLLLHSTPDRPSNHGDGMVRGVPLAELTAESFRWSESFQKSLYVWKSPVPTAAKVTAFNASLVGILPGLVRGIWASWAFYFWQSAPEATSIIIYLTLLLDKVVLAAVMPSGKDRRSVPPPKGQDYTSHTAELAKLAVGARGADFPAIILIKYDKDKDRVEVEIDWDPTGQGVDVALAEAKIAEWQKKSRKKSDTAAMRAVHLRRGKATDEAEMTLAGALDKITTQSFRWSVAFTQAVTPIKVPGPTVPTVQAFEDHLVASLPHILRWVWDKWTADVPTATSIHIYAPLLGPMTIAVVEPGDGGGAPPLPKMMWLADLQRWLARITYHGVRGTHYPTRLLLRYTPDKVDIDMTWDVVDRTVEKSNVAQVYEKIEEWREALRDKSDDEARWIWHSTPARRANCGDSSVVGADVGELSLGSFTWSEEFRKRLGL